VYKNRNTRIHRTLILHFFLYGCETWPVTRQRDFGSRVLGKIFGLERDEERGDGKILRSEELHDLY
jgi:hypothetical protein